MSEENVITCKFEDISPLGFTLNAARFKPSISLSFVNEFFRNNKKGALTIVKRWIENKLLHFYDYELILIKVETSKPLIEELNTIPIPSMR